jgi:hypothetical protein
LQLPFTASLIVSVIAVRISGGRVLMAEAMAWQSAIMPTIDVVFPHYVEYPVQDIASGAAASRRSSAWPGEARTGAGLAHAQSARATGRHAQGSTTARAAAATHELILRHKRRKTLLERNAARWGISGRQVMPRSLRSLRVETRNKPGD